MSSQNIQIIEPGEQGSTADVKLSTTKHMHMLLGVRMASKPNPLPEATPKQTSSESSSSLTGSQPPNIIETRFRRDPMVRNTLLFSLGVLFLEIAYSDSFRSLCNQVLSHYRAQQSIINQGASRDDDRGTPALPDSFIADHLVSSVSADMGLDYASITRQLLDCDFGAGRDLTSAELQERVYRDVVGKLDELEAGFRRLQCGGA